MELTKTELNILSQLAKGIENLKEIAVALKKSKSQIYRTTETLEEKGLIEKGRSRISPKKEVHVSLLLNSIRNNPALINVLSDSGLKILELLREPKDAKQLILEIRLSKTIVYRKIKQAINMSLIRRENGKFELNSTVWLELRNFIDSLSSYEHTLDKRIPAESIIYQKDNRGIIFSTISEQKAALTAFSAFGDYKIKILTPENFYYLPNKKLSIKDIFKHSLIIAEKKNEHRYFLYAALFYIKLKRKLNAIKSPVLTSIKLILKGEHIKGYPALSEIKEKARLYDIKI